MREGPLPGEPETRPRPTVADLNGLIVAAPLRSSSGLRNRALVALLLYGGLRVGEALAATGADVDADGSRLQVTQRGATRSVTLSLGGVPEVSRWAAERADLGVPGDAPFLCTLTGHPLTGSYVRELIPRLAAAAGVSERVSAEVLRNAHVTELARAGWSVRRLQAHLGHAAASSTRRLLDRLDLPARGASAPTPMAQVRAADRAAAGTAAAADITEETRQTMLDAIGVAAFAIDAGHRIIHANHAAAVLMGTHPGPPAGLRLPVPMLPDLGPTEVARRVGDGPFTMEGRAGGERPFPALVNVTMMGPRGAWTGYVVTVDDISDHLLPLRRLRASRETYRSVVENAPDAILRLDRDLRVRYANRGTMRTLGVPPSALVGQLIADAALEPDVGATLTRDAAAAIASERIRHAETAGATSRRRVEWRVVPELAPDGTVSHILCIGSDITERHAAQEALSRTALDSTIQVHALLDGLERPDGAVARLAAQIGSALRVPTVAIAFAGSQDDPGVRTSWSLDADGGTTARMEAMLTSGYHATRTEPVAIVGDPRPHAARHRGQRRPTPARLAAARIPTADGEGVVVAAFDARSMPHDLAERLEAFAHTCAGLIAATRMHRRSGAPQPAAAPHDHAGRVHSLLVAEAANLVAGDGGMLVAAPDGAIGSTVAVWSSVALPAPSTVGDRIAGSGSCAAARCLATRATVYIGDVTVVDDVQTRRLTAAGFRSALAVPLETGTTHRAVLCVTSTRRDGFTDADRRRLEEYAGAVGVSAAA